jgi:hypothetical protein
MFMKKKNILLLIGLSSALLNNRSISVVFCLSFHPDEVNNFLIYLILPTALLAWDLLSLEQKQVPGIFQRSKVRSPRKADNLCTDCPQNVGASAPHNPMDLDGLLQG